MEPFVLLELARSEAHGYELAQAIAALGFRRAGQDPSVVYRLLRALEADGLATSEWGDGDGGPPRRVYKLTRAGSQYLDARAEDMRRQVARATLFLDRYRSFSRTRTRTRTTRARPHPQKKDHAHE
jgi:PadR family transcriptional regulator PadR